jgi:hypothetical protein
MSARLLVRMARMASRKWRSRVCVRVMLSAGQTGDSKDYHVFLGLARLKGTELGHVRGVAWCGVASARALASPRSVMLAGVVFGRGVANLVLGS